MVEKNYKKIIIFEDDAKFSLHFKSTLTYFIEEMKSKDIKWELLYNHFLTWFDDTYSRDTQVDAFTSYNVKEIFLFFYERPPTLIMTLCVIFNLNVKFHEMNL